MLVLVLSFTRGREHRPHRGHGLAGPARTIAQVDRALVATGVLASLPAPLLFAAPFRDNLAYTFNAYRVPTDTSWSSILSEYPHQIASVFRHDLAYPLDQAVPPLAFVMGALVLIGLVKLYVLSDRDDPFLILARGAGLGSLVTVLIAANYSNGQLELVLIPTITAGLRILAERHRPAIPRHSCVRGRRTAAAVQPHAGVRDRQLGVTLLCVLRGAGVDAGRGHGHRPLPRVGAAGRSRRVRVAAVLPGPAHSPPCGTAPPAAEGLADATLGQVGLAFTKRLSVPGMPSTSAPIAAPRRRDGPDPDRAARPARRAARDGERTRYHRRFANNLLKIWPALWTFVTAQGLEPTNNAAERCYEARSSPASSPTAPAPTTASTSSPASSPLRSPAAC